MKRKGIILAGGLGTRLYPATKVVSKQLLPVFDKPMIYYPLSTLMAANVRELLIISAPNDIHLFEELLGDGSQWGLKIEYAVQPSPDGLAQALIIAEKFLKGLPSVLILGDNIFHGSLLNDKLAEANTQKTGATIFGYEVQDSKRYGVVEFEEGGRVLNLEEKPSVPKSNYAITGLYFFDEHAPKYAKQIRPSLRGELEIIDLNKIYLEKNQLKLELLDARFTWLDMGTHESLIEAHQLVQTIEHRQGKKIACLEEIAFRKHWINEETVRRLAQPLLKANYGKYLMKVLEDNESEHY
jgi:glucose-1-phosphate thymidylyltransferase